MSAVRTMAIDAMGGDIGPEMVVPALDLIAARHPDWKLLMFGDRARLDPLLPRLRLAREVTELRHGEIAIGMDDKPSQALRRGRGKSSMWLAIECGEGRRGAGRAFRRQYRRSDGDGDGSS